MPSFLRVSGFLDNVNTFKIKKLVLFFSDFEAIPLDLNIPYEIGCSTAAKADVKCYYYKGVSNVPCTASGGICNSYQSTNRLEILMSSTISSIADIYQIQVLVPIYIAPGTVHSFSV